MTYNSYAADNRSLGTMFTPESLQQVKTGIQNNLSYLLKRNEKLEDFQFFMGLYIYVGKRNVRPGTSGKDERGQEEADDQTRGQ